MIKWLLVIGVVLAVYYLFIKKKPSVTQTSQNNNGRTTQQDVEEMVECSRCGVYVELEEAILSNGKYYCSKECIKG